MKSRTLSFKLERDLLKETEKSAKSLGINMSDYIRASLRLGNTVMKVDRPDQLVSKINRYVAKRTEA